MKNSRKQSMHPVITKESYKMTLVEMSSLILYAPPKNQKELEKMPVVYVIETNSLDIFCIV